MSVPFRIREEGQPTVFALSIERVDAAESVPKSEAARHRYLFVDLLRAVAVLFMVETHVVNALLRADLKEGAVFGALNFANGLVAPTFLFLAGFNFMLSADRNWSAYSSLARPFWRQLGRIGGLLLFGYVVHLPFLSLARTLSLSRSQLANFAQGDVLQAIAISLLIPLLAVPVLRDQRRLTTVALASVVAIVLSTPIVWSVDLTALPLPLATYISPQLGSPFPLFPWTAFVLCGLVTGQIFLTARRLGDERQFMAALANVFCAGLLLVMLGPVVDSHVVDLYPRSDVADAVGFYAGTPGFFALRLGIVLMAFSALGLRTIALQPRSRIMRWLQVIGQRSLLIYVLGLFLLFGWVLDLPRLVEVLGPTLDFAECLLAFVAVATAASLVGYAWHWCARSFRPQTQLGQYAAIALFVWAFLIRS